HPGGIARHGFRARANSRAAPSRSLPRLRRRRGALGPAAETSLSSSPTRSVRSARPSDRFLVPERALGALGGVLRLARRTGRRFVAPPPRRGGISRGGRPHRVPRRFLACRP